MAEDSSRFQWWRVALPVGILIALFAWLLPAVIDYADVWAALTEVSLGETALFAALALAWVFTEAAVITTLIPGLGVVDGVKAFAASLTVGAAIPAPWDVLTRYGMYRAYGVDKEPAGAGVVVGGTMTLAVKLVTPILVLLTWIVLGSPGRDAVRITVFATGLAIAAAAAIAAALRYDAFATWFGRAIQNVANWLLPVFGREPRDDLEAAVVGFRDRLVTTLRARWGRSLGSALGAHVIRFIGMVIAFRAVGIGADQVSVTIIGATYALSLLASMTPMVPAGLGAVELVYIWVLGQGHPDLVDEIAAATFLHRVWFWLAPVLLGVLPLVQWIRGAGGLAAATEEAEA